MAERRPAGPSVGSGCGFGCAGSGVGAVAAMVGLAVFVGGRLDDLPDLQAAQLLYGTIYAGSALGAVVGVGLGVRYALRRRPRPTGPGS